MGRADLLEKTLMLGKTDGKRRGGWQRMRWLDTIMDSMAVNFPKSQTRLKRLNNSKRGSVQLEHKSCKGELWKSDWEFGFETWRASNAL